LNGVDHRLTSLNQSEFTRNAPDNLKSSLEGLSEREVRILVQDEFTPMASKLGQHKSYTIESNGQSGSGVPTTTTSTPDGPIRVHDGVIASMAAKIPIAPTMNLTTAEQLIRETKAAATSGDLFMTGNDFVIDRIERNLFLFLILLDWAIGQGEKKHPVAARSKSEPRNVITDLHDENILSEQKRDLVKKILMLQRQKFKDNQARKTHKSNEFENSTYSFSHMNQTLKNDDEHAALFDK
jgi:hypothetical protein